MGRKYVGVNAKSETSIEISFQYNGIRCREFLKLEPTTTNLKRASLFRSEILAEIENGTFSYEKVFPGSKNLNKINKVTGPYEGQLLSDYLKYWLFKKDPSLKRSTFENYRKIIDFQIIPNIGHIPINRLKRNDVRKWVSQLKVSNKRIANLVSPLRTALRDAVQDEVLENNPLQDWSYKNQEAPKEPTIDPFTSDEQQAILAELEGQAKNLIQFAFWTGLRTSELIALEWRDINLTKGVIYVSRAKTSHADTPESTKTRSGVRTVKLLPSAIRALDRQSEFTANQSGPIFHNPNTNKPWIGDKAIREGLWKPALKKAGVRYRYPYQTRHTYASMMLSAGELLAWVSNQMGHNSILITAQAYARWIPDSAPDSGMKAVEAFDC
jgi:integrase